MELSERGMNGSAGLPALLSPPNGRGVGRSVTHPGYTDPRPLTNPKIDGTYIGTGKTTAWMRASP
jgi:hypothetical protein